MRNPRSGPSSQFASGARSWGLWGVLLALLPGLARGQDISARVMYDFLETGDAGLAGTARFRRQRLLADWERGRLRLRGQAEFTGGGRFLELYGDVSDLPFGSLRVGHFREPQGLEAHTSSAYTSFLERAAPGDAFTPGRNHGVRVSGLVGDWAIAAGVFREADDVDGPRGDGRSVTARVARMFGAEDPAATLVHAGVSASLRDPRGDPVRLRGRAGTDLVPRFVDTGDLEADEVQVIGLEAAWRSGPASLQGEAFLTSVDLDAGGMADLSGAYLQAAYTLTGEGRGYSRSRSAFTGIEPEAPYPAGGRGAWEVAARFSRTDLENGAVRGDRQDAWTLGLNAYLTRRSRVSLDWVRIDLAESGLRADLLLMRLQIGI